MTELGGGCRRHRAALIDFVDHGEIGPATGAALVHLDRCARCTSMLDATVLTLAAMRRLGDEVARVEPMPDSWPVLRARVTAWRPSRVSFASPLAGMVTSVALCVVLAGTINVGRSPTTDAASELALLSGPSGSAISAVYTSSAKRGGDSADVRAATTPRGGIQPRIVYPDGARPTPKEVLPLRSIARPIEPR
jgi:hypothetical protein